MGILSMGMHCVGVVVSAFSLKWCLVCVLLERASVSALPGDWESMPRRLDSDAKEDVPTANGFLLVLVSVLLSYTFSHAYAPYPRFLLLGLLTIVWGYVTISIAKPGQQAQARKGTERLQAALKSDPKKCATNGVTGKWYDLIGQVSRRIMTLTVLVVIIILVGISVLAFPESVVEWVGQRAQSAWEEANHRVGEQREMFIGGIVAAHLLAFWGTTVCFGFLDLTTSKSLLKPFKVQESFCVTWKDMLKVCCVALMNQLLVVAVCMFIWDSGLFTYLAPGGFDAELPGLFDFVLQLAVCVPFAEITFYGAHRLLHTDWLFEHVHYIHHSWTAPFAPCCVYAHPLEFLMGNVSVILVGPSLMGCHVVVWYAWAFLATVDTAIAHSGWHLPYFPSPEAHDYHHSSGTIDNLGVIGALDCFFETNKQFLASWYAHVDKTYPGTGDYAVDKILYTTNGSSDEDERRPTSSR